MICTCESERLFGDVRIWEIVWWCALFYVILLESKRWFDVVHLCYVVLWKFEILCESCALVLCFTYTPNGYPYPMDIIGFGHGHCFSPMDFFMDGHIMSSWIWIWIWYHSTRAEPNPLPSLGRRQDSLRAHPSSSMAPLHFHPPTVKLIAIHSRRACASIINGYS